MCVGGAERGAGGGRGGGGGGQRELRFRGGRRDQIPIDLPVTQIIAHQVLLPLFDLHNNQVSGDGHFITLIFDT